MFFFLYIFFFIVLKCCSFSSRHWNMTTLDLAFSFSWLYLETYPLSPSTLLCFLLFTWSPSLFLTRKREREREEHSNGPLGVIRLPQTMRILILGTNLTIPYTKLTLYIETRRDNSLDPIYYRWINNTLIIVHFFSRCVCVCI
jgi:hypothetical protein